MNFGIRILDDMLCLIDLFEPHCEDLSTLTKLKDMVGESNRWPQAHGLFQEIRQKNLKAIKSENRLAECQYCFEEICAKTLFNMSRSNAPFDPDSPYWIIPNALSFGRAIGISDADCIRVIMGPGTSDT